MTQLQAARKGIVTPEMVRVAQRECVTPEFIRDEVARGRLVIPANIRHLAGSAGEKPNESSAGTRIPSRSSSSRDSHPDERGKGFPQGDVREGILARAVPTGHPGHRADAAFWVNQTVAQRWAVINDPDYCRGERAPKRLDPMGIGRTITTKINANIGASPVASDTKEEVDKLTWAQKYGADTLMDLSTGGNLVECRQAIIDHSTIPIGTVPIYSMIIGRSIEELTYDDILKEVERQAIQGVDYFTIHAGVLLENLHLIKKRVTGLVSRGG